MFVCIGWIITVQHPAKITYHTFTPNSLIPFFHCLDILMKSFTLIITNCPKIFRKKLKRSKLTDGSKDEGTGNWIVISSAEDLFCLNIDVDFDKLDYKPMLMNEVNHYDSERSSSESHD